MTDALERFANREHHRDSRAALVVFAAAFLFVGGIFVAIGGRALLDQWRYQRAVATEAIATGKTLRFATATSDTAYELSYRAVLEGQPHERTEGVPVQLWERVEPGSTVHVEHLPGRPESVRVVTEAPSGNAPAFVFTAIGVLLILTVLVAGTRLMRRRGSPQESPQLISSIAIPTHEPSYWPLARRSAEFWVGAIFLVAATPIVVASLTLIAEEWRFARHGVSTDGMILTKEIKRSGRSQRTSSYEATYRVMVPEGAFEARAELSYDAWARLKERQAADVLYLPDRPATSRLAGTPRSMLPAFMALAGSVFFAIGATFLNNSIRRARLEWRLRQRGAATDGVVIELCDRRLRTNGVQQWRLRYEYNDYQGRRHTGTHDLPLDEALGWKVGDAGAVRYDPGKPADAIWLGRPSV